MDSLALVQYLENNFSELTPEEFYRLIFPEGSLMPSSEIGLPYEQVRGHYSALALELKKDRTYSKVFIIPDELNNIDEIVNRDSFVVISPFSYVGTHRRSSNARRCFAIAIDLDGITTELQIKNFFRHVELGRIPIPTAVVWSGTGCHIYYIFKKEYPCFEHYTRLLSEVKSYLTKIIYHNAITTLYNNPQNQSINQAFRMVGSLTKTGENRTRAFLTGAKVDIEYLIDVIEDDTYNMYEIKAQKEKVSLAEAEILWPDWYQRRIIEKQPKKENKYNKYWKCNKNLYLWWIKKIKREATVGHRYFTIFSLAIFGIKCDIPEEEVRKDAYSLIDFLDSLTVEESNHFTKDDVEAALKGYKECYKTFPGSMITKLTGIEMGKNDSKRKNKSRKTREENLKELRERQNKNDPEGKWRNKNGRPKKDKQVINWRNKNPNGTKTECMKATGLCFNTVNKYWDDIEDEE